MRSITMRFLKTTALTLALLSPVSAWAEQAILYKNPQCDCCEGHPEHLRQNGLDVKSIATHDLALMRQQRGVPMELVGGHMLLIYVSAAAIKRLTAERPPIKGILRGGWAPAGSAGPPPRGWTSIKAGTFTGDRSRRT
jgi:hypothetical protein